MPFRRRALQHPDSNPPPRSAAWLAGERIFQAPPPQPEPAAPVAVTFKRSRLAAAAAGESADGVETSSPEGKGPRVFRLESASNEPTLEPPAPASAALAETGPASVKPRSRQRIGTDRRPGPVVQVFRAEPVAAAEAAPEVARPLAEQLRALRVLMSEVNGILADAQRARALRFVDAA